METTAQFTEAIDEMKAQLPGDIEKTHIFSEKQVKWTQIVFFCIMFWFAFLLLVWDVVIPYAAIKAAYWSTEVR